ncbi:hemolysin family protein [Pontiella sp.]|uniref:hemolysin family protein n=1 Tax=Pontiella sp. TaxID=2837462 RepID=UPI00356547AC
MDILNEHLLALLGMALLLLGSAFFSGTETALFSLSRDQIKDLREHGHHVDRLLKLLHENPSGLLVAILFGNLVVNILFFCTSAVLALDVGRAYGDWWQAAAGFAVLVTVILAGEILPKAIGISFPGKVVKLNSPLLRGWFHFLGPVRVVLEAITRKMEPSEDHDNRIDSNELRMLIDATHHDPTFGLQEKAIVEDIVNLPEIRLREIMVPRVRQLFRRADAPAGEALAEAAEQELELIPIYEEEEDNIVGVVEVRDLFVNSDPDKPLIFFSRPVKFVPETKRADTMLREFLDEGLRMVCVVDEYGGLAGTVVMEDLLEEVVGEFDATEVPPVEQLSEMTYRLQGNLGIREWRELFVGFLPDEVMRDLALDTLSGFVVSLLKRLPAVNDVVEVGNLRFTVEKVRSNRIETILLELIPDENGGEG